MAKDENISTYSRLFTQNVETVLLDLWGRLGEYRKYLVLVGGLAPRYITAPEGTTDFSFSSHCGTMDIDLGISLAVNDEEKYKHIRKILKDCGFDYLKHEDGARKSHSFEVCTDAGKVSIDFMTTAYNEPFKRHVQKIERTISAIKVPGIGLALQSPLMVKIHGKNRKDDFVTETIPVCRPVAFIVLKALAFDSRHKEKDSYDLVYTLKNYQDGAVSVAKGIMPSDRSEPAFLQAIETLKNRFASPSHDGPRAYARFLMDSTSASDAYATIQDFLDALEIR